METRSVSLQEALDLMGEKTIALEKALVQVMGELRGTKLALDTVIESHPAPQRLHEIWQRILPEVAEGVIDGAETPLSKAGQEGWKRALAHYSELFQAVNDRAQRRGE